MEMYKYRFSATVEEPEFKEILIKDLKNLHLAPLEKNNVVTVEGEAKFEVCMGYMARFLHFDEHEFYLSQRR